MVKIGNNLKIIQITEIACFYSENKIVYAQAAARAFPTDFTLYELEKGLNAGKFFCVSRQVIINLDFIKNVQIPPVYSVELQFQPAEGIAVSRERVWQFKEWLGYLMSVSRECFT